MKKLIMATIVGFAALTSQAYAIKWSALNIKAPIASEATVNQTGIVGTGDAMTGLAVSLYWVSTAGDVAIGTYTSEDGKIAAVTLGDGTDSALYTAMVADRGDSWKPQYHFTATYKTAEGVYVYDGTTTASQALSALSTKAISSAANFSTAGTWSYTANTTSSTEVPEPTSGLLILLGMAGIALKRKRA